MSLQPERKQGIEAVEEIEAWEKNEGKMGQDGENHE